MHSQGHNTRENLPFGLRSLLAAICIAIAASIWLSVLHVFYAPGPEDMPGRDTLGPTASQLAQYHIVVWSDPKWKQAEIDRLRTSNAEWDFMGRTFLVGALANLALAEDSRAEILLPIIDEIIDETVHLEREHGFQFFLMPYGHRGGWTVDPPRSLFVDGEIAFMMAHRRMVREKLAYKADMARRLEIMEAQMARSPVLCGESYPDECWMFCNSMALAAMKLGDHLDGTDHSAFFKKWIDTATRKLVDPQSRLLVSSFSVDGQRVSDGPEGSSIWVVTHCLSLIDPDLARTQYDRARRELFRSWAGFGYAREWPETAPSHIDIDSGTVVPGVGLSPSSSGLLLIAAATFQDTQALSRTLTTLNLGGFPSQGKNGMKFLASNPVGDAVILYALTQGPVWQRVRGANRR